MRIFFDTEFFYEPNNKYPTLLSIGMVRDDGKQYYAILDDADPTLAIDPFIARVIIPRLGSDKPKSRSVIAEEIKEFVGKSPVFWGYFADYDWVLFSTLYGGMLDMPSDWPQYCLDIVQEMRMNKVTGKVLIDKDKEHNALYDALWTQKQYHFVDNGV